MESHKLAFKLFVEDPSGINARRFVPVFHGWIQRHALADHLAIDVADYAHVPEGPGTVLVTHEANLSTDCGEGRLGLLYFRKQPFADADSFPERLRATFRAALEAAALLEQDPAFEGKLRFRTDEIAFRIHDRLLAPNTPATFDAVRPDLEAFLSDLYGGAPVTLEHHAAPEALFEVRAKAPENAGVAVLRERIGASVVGAR